MNLPLPPGGDLYLSRLVSMLRADWGRKEALIIGLRHDGENIHARVRPAASVEWVQVHVQSTEAGKGGASYDPANYVSATLKDCRSARVVDVSVPDLPYGRYWVWAIPAEKAADGTVVLYDGQDGRPDYMSFADLGV